MNFDKRGHLTPYSVVEMSLAEFEYYFVRNMPSQEHRSQMFENYLRYVNDLRSAFQSSFHQWVDGSFVTQKEYPRDIDLVTFLKFEVLNRKNHHARFFLQNSKSLYGVDGYFAATCRNNHYYYENSQEDERYWLSLFGFSREDEMSRRQPKGFIKIQF